MKLYGIVYEDENGDFQAVSSFGSSTAGNLRIFDELKQAQRSMRGLRNRPHLKDKKLLFATFELQGASEDITEIKKIEEMERKNEIF